MHLNINQKQAIYCISGPCLVLAGAGSGKTQVIVKKIIYLINECKFHPSDIFAITFTNKAAKEMKNRVSNQLSCDVLHKVTISTFHSLGLEIIKSEINSLNIKSNFSIFDEQDQMAVLKNITKKNDKIFLKKVRIMISSWKNKLLDSYDVRIKSNSILEQKYCYYYQLYESYLKSCNTLDFDDLIFLPTLLLKKNKILRKKWGNKIKYLLVDEYQDTNSVQYELIKLLNEYNPNFTLVGDDDQSIYSWRGVKSNIFSLLKSDYPKLNIIKLEHNYRSSGRILKIANFLIQNNPHFLDKKLFSNLAYGPIANIMSAKNEEDEAILISQTILKHKSTYVTQYKDYSILYRSNYQAKVFEKIFMNFDIPYQIIARSSFFSRPEIKDVLAYLKLIFNSNDDIAFLKIINKPPRGIGKITLNKLKEWSKRRNTSLFKSTDDIGLKFFLTSRSFDALRKFFILIQSLKKDMYVQPMKTLCNLISSIGYKKWLLNTIDNLQVYTMSVKNIHMLLNWIVELINSNKENSNILSDIIYQFILKNELEDQKKHVDGVQLMTLHASKGLEFSYVFMIGMEEGILPHYNSINNIDEERRLTYVGITRAKKELFFSYSKTRFQYGTIISTTPSRFLLELPSNDVFWNRVDIKKNNIFKLKNSLYVKNR
ncbi:MAG: UvrD-helicase domain-containing protein [Buchnera aphidicola (Schlechtendalia peitan)]